MSETTNIARAAQARKEARHALKPYYQDGLITLYQGDFRAVLPTLPDAGFDALITDPPYACTNLAWDKPIDLVLFWEQMNRLCAPTAPMVLFSSGLFTIKLINSNLQHYRYDLVWEKTMPTGFLDAKRRPLRAHETICFFARTFKGSTFNPQMTEGEMHKRGSGTRKVAHYKTQTLSEAGSSNLYYPRSILRFPNTRAKSLHPTQKSLPLMEWLVATYSSPGQVLLDPFAGSGTTLVAAMKAGRRAIGVELDAEYCEIAAHRLRETAKELQHG